MKNKFITIFLLDSVGTFLQNTIIEPSGFTAVLGGGNRFAQNPLVGDMLIDISLKRPRFVLIERMYV